MAAAFQANFTAMWLAAAVVLLIVEGLAPGLVSIWFALGALAAMLSAVLHAPLWLQCVWFVVVSVGSLLLTRPLAKKYVNARTVRTNADMVLGQDCVVTETIDNLRGTGAVNAGGKIWTARMTQAEDRAEKGEVLRVLRIEGVKLIVERKDK